MKVKEKFDDNEGFRVSVCLRRFFEDERAQCYMWVCGRRSVRSLRRRLRRLFPLPPRLALRCRGHLLPPAEPLALLRPDDAVEVILLSDTWDWAYRKKLTETCEEAASVNSLIMNQTVDSNKSGINELEVDNYIYGKSNTMDTENPSDGDVIDGNSKVGPEDIELIQIKEQALALLQKYEVKSTTIDMCPKRGSKRVRRRVRRRKPRQVQSNMNDDVLDSSAVSDQSNQKICQSQMSVHLSAQVSSIQVPEPPDVPLVKSSLPLEPIIYHEVITAPNIVRNDAAIPRKARIVTPLDSEIMTKMPHNLITCQYLQVNE